MSDSLSAQPFASPASRRFPWWVLLGAVLLPCLYLPTLTTRFDFIDDGNLVHPAPSMSWDQHLSYLWEQIVANYEHLGPFRPVLWAHWHVEANVLNADAVAWRSVRLVWTMLAAGAFLWLLYEMGIRPRAALLSAALAMWNPFRNEIWTSLTLAEGVAMPYALLSLVCALRAARSSRAWAWDVAGACCVLAALGCKNTFAALVPVQMLLRIAPDGKDLRAGWRRHGRRACLLALTLAVPVGHYILFKLNWAPGQYQTNGTSWAQLTGMIKAIKGAVSLEFVAAGLVLALVALVVSGAGRAAATTAVSSGWLAAAWRGLSPIWREQRAACLAGLALLVFGIGIYLPIGAVSGRYTMPAVWGADLWIAALLSTLAGASALAWKRAAHAVFLGGLLVVAVANVGRQDKFSARAQLLWDTLEYVQRQAPPDTCLAWMSSPELNVEEGIQFFWHLQQRGRRDVAVRLFDEKGQPVARCETPHVQQSPTWLVSGVPNQPLPGSWHIFKDVTVSYWCGQRSQHLHLWASD
ncbi:MAG TPA: hypothetical protein VEL76_39620 [Gemmataceae bacterium]|nr:hypothetical protein [Gemmataceae bacterium]